MGDEITVMVTDIDPQGKIRLSGRQYGRLDCREAREKDQRKPGAVVETAVAAVVSVGEQPGWGWRPTWWRRRRSKPALRVN